MGFKRGARATLLPEPKRYAFSIDTGERLDEVTGTDAVEFGGSLYIYDEKEKVAIYKIWKSILRKTPA